MKDQVSLYFVFYFRPSGLFCHCKRHNNCISVSDLFCKFHVTKTGFKSSEDTMFIDSQIITELN